MPWDSKNLVKPQKQNQNFLKSYENLRKRIQKEHERLLRN